MLSSSRPKGDYRCSSPFYQNVLNPLSAHTSEQGSGDLHHCPVIHMAPRFSLSQCTVRRESILQEQELSSTHEPNPKHLPKAKPGYLWPSQIIYDLLFSSPPRAKHTIRANQGPLEVTGLWRRPLTPAITAQTWLPESCLGNITPHSNKSLRLSLQWSFDSPLKC